MNKFKGFTLTELLVALAVIGILIAILIPAIVNLMPDQNALMAKRAYYTVQSVVSDLINDEGCYPDKTQSIGEDRRIGFDDGYGYPNCIKWGGSAATSSYINSENAAAKFANLFADKVDLRDNTSITYSNSAYNFVTKDAMTWALTPMDGSNGQTLKNRSSALSTMPNIFSVIRIDVNGAEKPNCGQSIVTSACSGNARNYDQFGIAVSADGSLTVLDGWARSAVKVSKDITGISVDSESTIAPR